VGVAQADRRTAQEQSETMTQDEIQTMPPDAQADERIAEFARLLAAALRRILAERAPDAETEQSRTNTPGKRIGADGGEP